MAKIALLFPGQGAQFVGMGAALIAMLPDALAVFDRARHVLGFDVKKLCLEGPKEELDATEICQPAIFTVSFAALEYLKSKSPEIVSSASATAGLSLGEYTALVFAGVMSFEDGLRLVQKRGQAMQAAANKTPGGMVSILGYEIEKVEEFCNQARGNDILQVANILCPGNTVVSGSKAACERIVGIVTNAGGMAPIPLAVAGAFHTPMMKPADEQLATVLKTVTFNKPRIPVLSNVDAKPHDEPDDIKQVLVKQLLSPVQWDTTMKSLLAEGYDQFYEVGPGKVLKGLLKRINRKIPCEGVDV